MELSRHPEYATVWNRFEIATEPLRLWRDNDPRFSGQQQVHESEWEEWCKRQDPAKVRSLGCVWIIGMDDRPRLRIVGGVGERYNVLSAYEKGKRCHKILATPHGFFWTATPDKVTKVAKFVTNFGPLEWVPADTLSMGWAWIDLKDFERKQQRFKSLVQIWSSLDYAPSLRKHLRYLAENLPEINKAERFPVGSALVLDQVVHHQDIPWKSSESIEDWLRGTDEKYLRQIALSLVNCELNAHLASRPSFWTICQPKDRPSFEFQGSTFSLWDQLWLLFALDTKGPRQLRICPHCEKLSYPPRSDRIFCTAELQQEYSKVKWWNENKELELAKRKARRRSQTGHWKR